ncbi:NgoFVII restriction endonuclease [Pedobacter terrae]|uniref:NgoFVII restriction endonuclease n=1 Tax=Pedobacter terrae TaxID=405671 RepID=A0A1G7QBJ9_9SPHI|nr:restriction endonuclease PLD domain-containing protein [Pedobacter terrae]SDF95864.1 NgoFVII restriction endonuclease [Pedobacter terrae]
MIINNLTRHNHLFYLNQIFHSAKNIFIISPFITKNIQLINFGDFNYLQRVTIVTTLKPFDKDQYTKIAYFKELYCIFNQKSISLEILIDNSLHGKIFLGEYNDHSAKAIITSANFTDSGLRINNEWGILIEDLAEINKVKFGIVDKVKYKRLNEKSIDDFIKKIEEYPKPPLEKNPIELNLSLLFCPKENFFNIGKDITFWLKPIGVTENRVPLDSRFDEVDKDLHFSKIMPKGVKKGDLLICYAVGHQNILSIYRVNSEVRKTTLENDRWPYYVVGENLTPNYGREWSKQNITISNQKDLVLKQGQFNVTPTGKNSFGSLMRGGDKLRLTREFGLYLFNKISKIDYDLVKS